MEYAYLKLFFIIKKVSIFINYLLIIIINIAETFRLLLQEKHYFYLNNNKSPPLEIEENKINKIIQKYNLDGIYYSLDKKNIFKRADRYEPKIKLIILFGILVTFHLFELIFNILMLTYIKKASDKFDSWERISTSFVSILNILVTLTLSTITMTKLRIQSYIFY